jgi:hypothetical protein
MITVEEIFDHDINGTDLQRMVHQGTFFANKLHKFKDLIPYCLLSCKCKLSVMVRDVPEKEQVTLHAYIKNINVYDDGIESKNLVCIGSQWLRKNHANHIVKVKVATFISECIRGLLVYMNPIKSDKLKGSILSRKTSVDYPYPYIYCVFTEFDRPKLDALKAAINRNTGKKEFKFENFLLPMDLAGEMVKYLEFILPEMVQDIESFIDNQSMIEKLHTAPSIPPVLTIKDDL